MTTLLGIGRLAPFLFSLIALLVVHVVDSFCPLQQQQQQQQHGRSTTTSSKKGQEWDDGDSGTLLSRSSSSYSNPWLSFFHNQAQQEKQLTTNSLAVWNEAQQREQHEKIREWQDSFHRNGFSDFCPPMSAGLQCLMIGNDNDNMLRSDDYKNTMRLPWEEEPQADITSLQVVVVQNDDNNDDATVMMMDTTTNAVMDRDAAAAAPMVVRTTIVSSSSSQQQQSSWSGVPMFTTNREKAAAVYDCIVDHGLLQAVLNVQDHNQQQKQQQQHQQEAAVCELLFEAATALKEHGIYILITTALSSSTRQLIQDASIKAGLEWAFELDGISDASQHQIVSVARRFNTGYMPKVGKLSRLFQP